MVHILNIVQMFFLCNITDAAMNLSLDNRCAQAVAQINVDTSVTKEVNIFFLKIKWCMFNTNDNAKSQSSFTLFIFIQLKKKNFELETLLNLSFLKFPLI